MYWLLWNPLFPLAVRPRGVAAHGQPLPVGKTRELYLFPVFFNTIHVLYTYSNQYRPSMMNEYIINQYIAYAFDLLRPLHSMDYAPPYSVLRAAANSPA